ncbi:MAG: hypothetical protein AAF621_00510 [Pseudomonadota bacterium]
MSDLVCKRCGSEKYVKNGKVRGHQRYKCKNAECGCNFISGDGRNFRKKPSTMRSLWTLLYAVGGMSFNGIARIFKVSATTVSSAIKEAAIDIPEPEIDAETQVVILDEMWHFIQKKLKNYGSGGQYVVSLAEPLDGCWVIVVKKLAES